MKLLNIIVLFCIALSFAACDDTTDTIGSSTTNKVDNLEISDAIYYATSRSLVADSVLSQTNKGIIGKVKDPETGTYVTGDYMSQFGVLPSFTLDTLAYIRAANNGEILADSCFILVSYESTYGDTLTPMKVTAYEMTKPLPEDKKYHSDFDVFEEGYADRSNFNASSTYTLDGYGDAFKIYLNKPYTKDGVTYNNLGTYFMRTWIEHPDKFKSNYDFIHDVFPGFYIEHQGGLGNIAKVWNTEIQFYYKLQKTLQVEDSTSSTGYRDSIAAYIAYNRFDGTEEVLQTNKITNDKESIKKLAQEENCTYLKSPAGIFTEVTLPVDDIMRNHENDTLNTVSITFQRMNNETSNEYNFDIPEDILMIPVDSLYSFFENGNINNNRTSYVTSYNSTSSSYTKNAYTFTNISNLITNMYKNKGISDNWNKVVLIPVDLTYVTRNSSQYITKITHNMGLTSTRLIRGTTDNPIEIKVIYSKFKEN